MTSTAAPPTTAPDLEPYLRTHRLLRTSARELAVAVTQAPRNPRTDRALQRWFDGFSGEIRCHHHIEDVLLFPALQSRVATYADHAPRLDGDHADLDNVLDGLVVALAASDRVRAGQLAVELSEHLDEHLDFEDDEIVPLFSRHFTGIEFDELNARAVKLISPKQILFTAPWTMSMLDDDERREVLTTVPTALHVIWRMTRGRYARLTTAAFAGAAS